MLPADEARLWWVGLTWLLQIWSQYVSSFIWLHDNEDGSKTYQAGFNLFCSRKTVLLRCRYRAVCTQRSITNLIETAAPETIYTKAGVREWGRWRKLARLGYARLDCAGWTCIQAMLLDEGGENTPSTAADL
jgi:hypothetical protein